MSTYADVLRVALSLSPEQRRELADAIHESLDREDVADQGPPELSEAWRAEIARRSAQIDRGEVEGIPWEEARRRVRSRYGLHD